jgi:hypothetical protein
VVALMFASDETVLASFGTSKVWPAYLMFGNESKARRGKSSLKLFEEVAYFQSASCSLFGSGRSIESCLPASY